MRSCVVSEASSDVKQFPSDSLALTICLGVFGQASQSAWCTDEIPRSGHVRDARPPFETAGQCLTTEDTPRTVNLVTQSSLYQYDQSRMPATDVPKSESRPGELCTISSDWARASHLRLEKRRLGIHKKMGSRLVSTPATGTHGGKRPKKDEVQTSSDQMLSGAAHLDQSALQPEHKFFNRTLRRNRSCVDTKHVMKETRSPLEVEASKPFSAAHSIVSDADLLLQQKSNSLIWVHSQDTIILPQHEGSATDAALDLTLKGSAEPLTQTLSPIIERVMAVTPAQDILPDNTNAVTREPTSLLKKQAMEPTLDKGSLSREHDVSKTMGQQVTTAISSQEPMLEHFSSFEHAQTTAGGTAGRSPEVETILLYLTSSKSSPDLKASLTKLEDFVETLRECKPRFEPLTYEDSDQKMVDATLRHFEYLVKFCLKQGQQSRLSIKLAAPDVFYHFRTAVRLARDAGLLPMMTEAYVKRAKIENSYPEILHVLENRPECKKILSNFYISLSGATSAKIDLLRQKFEDSPAPILFFCALLRSLHGWHKPHGRWLCKAAVKYETEGIQAVTQQEWPTSRYFFDRCIEELKELFSFPFGGGV